MKQTRRFHFAILVAAGMAAVSSGCGHSPGQGMAPVQSALGEIKEIGRIQFQGELHEPQDISGIAKVGDLLVIGSDEGHVVQVLRRVNDRRYELVHKFTVPEGKPTQKTKKNKPEIDIEGIAAVANTVYVVGSHSSKRGKVKPAKKRRAYSKNRKRLYEIEPETPRRVIYRFTLSDDGTLVEKPTQQDGIYDLIRQNDLLSPFTEIPGKENGIDIEGIAVDETSLYLGFRGPVLRENWVPVLVTTFDMPRATWRLMFVNLDGLGIRDMTRVSDGFLIIGGPVGDRRSEYKLYHWNGQDCLRGDGGESGEIRLLGVIPSADGAKAEGIAVMAETADAYEAIVVYDSVDKGGPKRFQISKSGHE